MIKMNSKQLRKTKPVDGQEKTIKKNPIYLVLDNVLDTYNIGSIFRLADAIAAEKVLLCGDMEYPPNSRIHKAAVGTEEWVPWQKFEKTSEAIKTLKEQGVQIVVVEQSEKAVPYTMLPVRLEFPVAIVVGHETHGVAKDIIDSADIVIDLPMFGVNKSLNVWGSAAIIAYKVIESLIFKPWKPKRKNING